MTLTLWLQGGKQVGHGKKCVPTHSKCCQAEKGFWVYFCKPQDREGRQMVTPQETHMNVAGAAHEWNTFCPRRWGQGGKCLNTGGCGPSHKHHLPLNSGSRVGVTVRSLQHFPTLILGLRQIALPLHETRSWDSSWAHKLNWWKILLS